MAMIDARQFNARFVETPVDGCEYFLASQCHPDTFDICRGRKITLWHVLSNPEAEMQLLDEYYCEPPGEPERSRCRYFPVTMGTTVAIRALSLLRMIGFCRFEIFGLDSCWMGNEHHAYRQAENDKEDLIHKAAGWMLREVGKRDEPALEAFLKQHYAVMARTMLRYAIERFSEKKRKSYLTGTA